MKRTSIIAILLVSIPTLASAREEFERQVTCYRALDGRSGYQPKQGFSGIGHQDIVAIPGADGYFFVTSDSAYFQKLPLAKAGEGHSYFRLELRGKKPIRLSIGPTETVKATNVEGRAIASLEDAPSPELAFWTESDQELAESQKLGAQVAHLDAADGEADKVRKMLLADLKHRVKSVASFYKVVGEAHTSERTQQILTEYRQALDACARVPELKELAKKEKDKLPKPFTGKSGRKHASAN